MIKNEGSRNGIKENKERMEKKKGITPKVQDLAKISPLITEIAERVEAVKIQNERRIWVEIKRENLVEFCRFIKECGFEHLSCILGVDRGGDLEVVYHLWSYIERRMISVKVRVPSDDPVVDSITGIWSAADWHERETFDMLGIVFRGHPNLKRIFLPENFEDFPLRKDFKLEEKGWI
jgi:NADH/F420H2 dehydrogenase subunit C